MRAERSMCAERKCAKWIVCEVCAKRVRSVCAKRY